MSEEQTPNNDPENPESRVPKEAPAKKSIFLQIMPFIAVASWLAAAAAASISLNPWGPFNDGSTLNLYGWAAPAAVGYGLLVLGAIFLGLGLWQQRLYWAYLAAAPLVPLGTGAKMLVGDSIMSGDLLVGLVYAAGLFLTIEYISALPRFREVVNSTRTLESSENRPVNRFLIRYVIGAIIVVVFYGAVLAALIQYVYPAIATAISPRMGAGLEMRSSLGITVFSGVLFALLILARLTFDGIMDFRKTRDVADDEQEVGQIDVDLEMNS